MRSGKHRAVTVLLAATVACAGCSMADPVISESGSGEPQSWQGQVRIGSTGVDLDAFVPTVTRDGYYATITYKIRDRSISIKADGFAEWTDERDPTYNDCVGKIRSVYRNDVLYDTTGIPFASGRGICLYPSGPEGRTVAFARSLRPDGEAIQARVISWTALQAEPE